MKVLRSERREKNEHAVEAGAFISTTVSNDRPEKPGEFDYDSVSVDDRIMLRQRANEIRALNCRTVELIHKTGALLLEARDRIGHGRFIAWLACEFPQWSQRTAYNYIGVAETFEFATVANSTLAPKILYDLISPSVPEAARDEIVERDATGETITSEEAKKIIRRAKAKSFKEATDKLPPGKRAQVRQIVQDAEDKRRASRGEALIRKGMEEFAGMGGDGQGVCEILERLLAHLPELLSGDAVGELRITTVEAA